MPELDTGRILFEAPSGPDLPKENTIDRIHRRARELWDAAGRPEGREADYRRQAEREILGITG